MGPRPPAIPKSRRSPKGAPTPCSIRAPSPQLRQPGPIAVDETALSENARRWRGTFIGRVTAQPFRPAAQQCDGADVAYVGVGARRGETEEWRLRLLRRRGAMCRDRDAGRPAPATQHIASRWTAWIQHYS